MRDLTDEEKEQLTLCGRVGFTYEEVALNFDLNVDEVGVQFANKEGEIFSGWIKGRLQAEAELRNATLKSAINGSIPSLTKMLEYYRKTDRIHNDL